MNNEAASLMNNWGSFSPVGRKAFLFYIAKNANPWYNDYEKGDMGMKENLLIDKSIIFALRINVQLANLYMVYF